jgi:hypothetical protein
LIIKSLLIHLTVLFPSLLLLSCSRGDESEVYRESEDGKKLFYLDYIVEKKVEFDDGFENHIMVLMDRKGNTIERFELGSDIEEMNTWKVDDVVKGGNRELIITQFSGGAHCCEYNWIYEFSEEPHEIFNSFSFGSLGFMAPPEDLNGDGNKELILQNLTFSYFYRCCYAASPFNSIILEYNSKKNRYVVQNLKFKDYLLAGSDGSIELSEDFISGIDPTAEPEDADPGGYFLGAIVSEVLVFLYAGEEEAAWKIFDTHYTLSDREEVKRLIKEKLERDICFQGRR